MLAALLLGTLMFGCNDGGIVGTGSGTESDANKQVAGASPLPAGDMAAATLAALSLGQQQTLCKLISDTIPARLLGDTVTQTLQQGAAGTTTFTCVWQPASVATGSNPAVVEVSFHGDAEYWSAVQNNIAGIHVEQDKSRPELGYRIEDPMHPCLHGAIKPPENGWVIAATLDEGDRCSSGIGMNPQDVLTSLNQLAKEAADALRKVP
jgi:hypothetical protein